MPKLPPIAQDRIANEMYEAAARSRDTEPPRNYLGMSEIGHACARKLWYSFRGYTPLPVSGRAIMIFRFGDHVEDDVVHWLRLAGYRVEGQQDTFLDHAGLFRGHCDGIIHGVTKRPHILEVKSCNLKKFKLFKSEGVRSVYPIYYSQVQCYMGYSGLDRSLHVIQCKDNSEIYTERMHFSKFDFESLRLRAKEIIEANEAPERPFEEDHFNCQWCDYRVHCWRPEEAILAEKDRKCGTCYYFYIMRAPRLYCRHPDHPFELKNTGGCPDWRNDESKAPVEKPKVELEELK